MKEEMTENAVAAIVAEVAQGVLPAESLLGARLRALEDRLHTLEEALKAKRSVEASAAPTRKVASAPRMMAKGAEPVQPAGVDAALGSLSVEQRIAVKAGLLRAGLL